uniref:Uncharacterized protein n=1 Tax=Fusarium oxysporum (strain Fo5176) TaxID=660025 RepID=A0A0D2XS40_FUSOF
MQSKHSNHALLGNKSISKREDTLMLYDWNALSWDSNSPTLSHQHVQYEPNERTCLHLLTFGIN